ncbi:MAG: hypothetical protein L3J07_02300 [Candidatus Magasanikbacteria bacterium]|nr:hypothetical protein [Candidatus Magasanikbacteria bacterium]
MLKCKLWQTFFGIISVLLLLISILTIIYWFYEININTVSFSILSITLISFFLNSKKSKCHLLKKLSEVSFQEKISLFSKTLFTSFVILSFVLFYTLLTKNYGDTLSSPWTIIGPKFFIVFTLTSFLLLLLLQTAKNKIIKIFSTTIYFALFLSVAIIIFKYGFGFDPFIHQAAEKFIKENGAIYPKQPYYLGQYSLVLLIHFLTNFSIEIIDKALVPISSAILIPLSTYFTFKKLEFKKFTIISIALIPLFPLSFFIQTTPNSLSLLLFYVVILWIWKEFKETNWRSNLFGILTSLTICLIHPLIGIPTLIIYIFSLLDKNNKIFSKMYGVLLVLAIPTTLIASSLLSSGKPNIHFNPTNFLELFKQPFWYIFENAPIIWRLLYFAKSLLIPTIILIAIYGFFITTQKYKFTKANFFAKTIVYLFISAFITSSVLFFTDVISYEQANYAKRILTMVSLILIPFIAISFREFFIKFSTTIFKKVIISILGSIFLLGSFYFTYPTRDKVSFYTGFTVRDADIEVVNFIENRNKDQDYIVITNQIISAAAIHEFGFKKYYNTVEGEQFFYSIPTGGPMYKFFGKMVYEDAKKEWMIEAMDFMGVDKAYFVHTSYWAPAGEIRDKAKLEADAWWEFGPMQLWVYEYTR